MDKKVKLKILLAALSIVAILFLIIGLAMYIRLDDPEPTSIPTEAPTKIEGHYVDSEYGKYIKYDEQEASTVSEIVEGYNRTILTSYQSYQDFINQIGYESRLTESDFDNNYYIIAFAENDSCKIKINEIKSIKTVNTDIDNRIIIEIGYENICENCSKKYALFLVPYDKNKINKNTTIGQIKYTKENFRKCGNSKAKEVEEKPIIYLYPEQETNVTIKLLKTEKITTTYPKYDDIWDVTAKPNGDLIDNKTGRSLYGLYWEGINYSSMLQEEGFIVKGTDTISFLEDSLAKLGLTEREANEFIIYWLPRLEKNKYNYIHFSGTEFMNQEQPLEVNPKPDTIIRILMEYKPLEKPIKVSKQELKAPKRTGFTLIEWGGTELK